MPWEPSDLYPLTGTVKIAGRRIRLGSADLMARNFVVNVGGSRLHSGANPLRAPLTRLRPQFREITHRAPIGGLILCLGSKEPAVQRLALWLLGRCHNKWAVRFIAMLCDSPIDGVRKEAARALARLGAWSELRAMAETETQSQVKRFLKTPERKSFSDRMTRFAENVTESNEPEVGRSRSRMSMFWRVLPGHGKSPKSPQYIRMLLERIRALLHRPA